MAFGHHSYRLYHFLWNALDWIFPPRCGGCSQFAQRWCPVCQGNVERILDPVCTICGSPYSPTVHSAATSICAECSHTPPAFTALRSFCGYTGPARRAIIRLKYSRDIGLGEALANQLAEYLQTLNWSIDLVTCVPLSRGRLRQRGYNQSAMIARPLAMSIPKPFLPVLLRKTREAPTQVGLSANDRRKNVDGAFETGGASLSAKRVLVIDDVTTTGSTMNACARALLDAGAASIYGLTFARAGLHDHVSVS
jgi:competence protein ComFC